MARTVVRIDGIRELEAALADLGKATGKNVLRRVARKMLAPLEADAKASVATSSTDTGALGESIGITSRLKRGQRTKGEGRSSIEMHVGTGVPHGHLVEFGTGERFQKNGKSVGASPAEPFMRPAWDAHKGDMPEEFGRLVWPEIEASARRQAKKLAKVKG